MGCSNSITIKEKEYFEKEKEKFEKEKEKFEKEKQDYDREKQNIDREKENIDKEKQNIDREKENIDREKQNLDRERRNIDREKDNIDREKQNIDKEKQNFEQEKQKFDKERQNFDKDKQKFDKDKKNFDEDEQNSKGQNENSNYLYCYNNEECLKIEEHIKENNNFDNIKEDTVVYYKSKINVFDKLVKVTEYITYKTLKKEGKKYSSSILFLSSTAKKKSENVSVKLNNNTISCQRDKKDDGLDRLRLILSVSLKENDNPLVTFEINSSYKYKHVYGLYTVDFYEVNYLFSLNIINNREDFCYSNGQLERECQLKTISPNEIIYSGPNNIYSFFCFRGIKNYPKLKKGTPASIQYNDEDISLINEVMKNYKLTDKECLLFVKEIYTINDRKIKVNVFYTYAQLSEGSISSTMFYRVGHHEDLYFVGAKNNNEKTRDKPHAISKNEIKLSYYSTEGNYFVTQDFEYTFSFNRKEGNKYVIPIFNNSIYCKEDVYYKFMLKLDKKEYSKYSLYREDEHCAILNDPNYNLVLKTYNKHYDDEDAFDYLYLEQ